MPSYQEAKQIIESSEIICSASVLTETVSRMATQITTVLSEQYPVVLCVMGGAVVFTGQLLPQLNFPLHFEYVHVSRYHNQEHPGELDWKVFPADQLKDRVVLVLDDILDEGRTMAAIYERVMASGAEAFYSAVLCEKEIGKPKPIKADFVGITVQNQFVFGFGMDKQGIWRNLPAIHIAKD